MIDPGTFNESERKLFGRMVIGAGLFFGFMSAALVAIFVWGGWPSDLYGQIITILGIGLFSYIGGSILVAAFMAIGGPVGKANAKVKDIVELGVEDKDDPVVPAALEAAGDALKERAEDLKP